jgi:hypothetical protein
MCVKGNCMPDGLTFANETHDKCDDGHNGKDEEQNFGDLYCASRNAAKAKYCGD